LSDYPTLELYFDKSNENLADFLLREGLPPRDLEKLDLKTIKIEEFYDNLSKKSYSLPEWMVFVENNPQYLSGVVVNKAENQAIVNALSRGLQNVTETLTPLDILKGKLTRERIIQAQKEELAELYYQCLTSKDFEFTESHTDNPRTYRLFNDLLMIKDNSFKILVPPSLIGPLLAHYHLTGHKGTARMLLAMGNFYFKNQ
jgi:hypothetical protein